jgi:predicted aspartyl protease
VSNLFASRLPKFFPSDLFSRCSLWLAILFITGSPAAAAEQRTGHSLETYLKRLGYEPIPLKRDHANHLYLYGEINGKSRSIMVDTGCSHTRVDTGAGRKLQKLGNVAVELEDTFLGRITNADVRLMSVKLGSAVFTNQPAWIRSLDASGQYLGDCLLGCDFLFRNFCLIDCLNQKLYVRATKPSANAEAALEESLRVSRFHEIRLRRTSSLSITVAGKAEGEPITLLVDTGAPWLQLDSKQEKRLRIEKHYAGSEIAGIGKIGSVPLYRTRLKSLELGDLSLKNVDVGIADLSGWKIGDSKLPLRDVDGILGADLLAYNRALIDYHSLKLWLQP